MALYEFHAESLGQCSRIIEALKELDEEVLVKEKCDLYPFQSNLRVRVQIKASYEEVLKNLSQIRNSQIPQETIRPLN